MQSLDSREELDYIPADPATRSKKEKVADKDRPKDKKRKKAKKKKAKKK